MQKELTLQEMEKDIADMLHGNPKAIKLVHSLLWELTGRGDKERLKGE